MDFKNGIKINGVAVQPGYPTLAGLTAGQVLRASNGTTVAFASLTAADLPTNVAYKDADNQFSVAQGFGAAASGTAERLYLATKVGGTAPLLYIGGWSSDALQVGIQSYSLTKEAVIGSSYSSVGVLGQMGSYLGIGVVAAFDNDTTTNALPSVLVLRHRSTAAAATGFGVQMELQAKTSTTNDAQLAQIASWWSDPMHGTRTSVLTFSTVYSGLAAAERLRISGYGYIGINATNPLGDLWMQIRDQEAATRGLNILGVSGTYAPGLNFRRSAGTFASPTATANGTELGRISFYAYASSAWGEGAYIRALNVTGGEPAANIFFAQDTGSQWVDTLSLVGGKVGVRTNAPNFTFEPLMLDLYPAINIKEAGTTVRRATIGFGLDSGVTTGWILGQGFSNNTVKDFYLLDATAGAIRLYVDTSGKVGIGNSNNALTTQLDVVRAQASQLRLASVAGTGTTMMAYSTGTTEALYIMVNRKYESSAFSRINTGQPSWTLSMGSQDQDTFKIYREDSGGASNLTLFQIDASGNAETIKGGTIRAVEGTYSAPSGGAGLEIASTGGIGYVQSYNRGTNAWRAMNINAASITFGGGASWGNFNANGHMYLNGRLYPEGGTAHYLGAWAGNGLFVTTHLLVGGSVFPGNQGSYFLSYTGSPAGLIVTGNLSSYHDIYPGNNNGTGGSQNASYYFRGETNSAGIRTNGNLLSSGKFVAGGGLGTNHLQALCASGLYIQMFSGEAGVSYTNGVIGYNYGNLNGSTAGQITAGNGGGLIRFINDGSGALITMDTSGTFRYLLEWGVSNLGVGVVHGSSNRLFTKGIDSTSSNNAFLAQNSASSNLMYLRNDGLAWVNQNWTVGSDARMKQAVRSMGQQHRKLHQLRTVEYELNHTGNARKHYGLLAEEVEQIYPELVEESHHNEPGAIPMKGVRYGDLIPLLIYEIQQLQAEVAALKKGNAK